MIVDWVEGETAPREFILKEDGVAFDATGFAAPELILVDRTGASVDTVGDVAWVTQSAGRLKYTPGAAGGVAMAMATRNNAVATDDPGTFTTENDSWTAITIVVRPAAGGAPPCVPSLTLLGVSRCD